MLLVNVDCKNIKPRSVLLQWYTFDRYINFNRYIKLDRKIINKAPVRKEQIRRVKNQKIIVNENFKPDLNFSDSNFFFFT